MSDMAATALERARELVGVKFRPQGRDPETGLDCIGLVLRAFAIPPAAVRRDYRMRGNDAAEIDRELRRFFRILDAPPSTADVLLCELEAGQFHLVIHCGDSFIHADARLRRTVEVPGTPPWQAVAAYRVTNSNLRSD